MSNSLQPHELQHARLLCLSLFPRVCSNSYPLSQWYHLTISSSVTSFSYCFQFFLESGSFPKSQLFTSGDQSIRVSASVLPMNIQGWFPLGLGLRDLQESSSAPQFKSINSSSFSFLYGPTLTLICDYWRNNSFDHTEICQQSYVSGLKYAV